MKKFMLAALFIGALGFVACGSDDDDGSSDDNGGSACVICEQGLGEGSTDVEYCNNGDGTMTVTTVGISIEQDLEGLSFDVFIDAIDSSEGISCNN